MKKLVAAVLTAGVSLVFASGALAASHNPTGEWANFAECPLNNPVVEQCVFSETTGGSVKLGSKTVPIVNPAKLQGGFSGFGTEIQFYGAENGETLSKAPQPVPGGLLGLLNCKEQTNIIIKGLCEAALENGLTGANATLELAAPATQIKINTENLIFEEGTALELPVKVHLENPLLGNNCYIGSNAKPIVIAFTTGTSGSLQGEAGEISFNELFDRTIVTGSKLVNNTFAAPAAAGCGGPLINLVVDPVVNSMVGLPAGSGTNSAILEANFETGAAESVRASEP
ncbi:MAG: hypothetical protein AB7V58_07965 [Solirubrobacterales bacterium]